MARHVVFRPEAEDELLQARPWYESRRSGLGRAFADASETVVERIAATTLEFPIVYREVRRAVLTRFPYAVYFRLANDAIVVLAVAGRQDPSRWQTRPLLGSVSKMSPRRRRTPVKSRGRLKTAE